MLITKKKQEIPTPLCGPRVYKACENAPRYDQSSRLGNRVRYDRCQHRLLYVDRSSTFIILYYSVPVLCAHSVQGCLLAVIACSANSSWLCSSATGLLNGSNGGSFVHWLKETPTPDFSKQERQSGCGSRWGDGDAVALGTPVCRPGEDGGDFTVGTSRQDLGYDGPWVCAACISFGRDIVGSTVDGTDDLTAG